MKCTKEASFIFKILLERRMENNFNQKKIDSFEAMLGKPME